MARANPGKLFEEDFRKSVPFGVYCYRLRDAGGWSRSQDTRFTPSNDFDHILYSRPLLFTLELKSVAGKSWPFSSLRQVQREGLTRAHECGAVAGVVFNFRSIGRTFFVSIRHLLEAQLKLGKKSLNVTDIEKIADWEIRCVQLRTRFRYDLGGMVAHFKRELNEENQDGSAALEEHTP